MNATTASGLVVGVDIGGTGIKAAPVDIATESSPPSESG